MLSLPVERIVRLAPFAQLVSEPVWRQAQVLVVGAIWVPGRRAVSSWLRVRGVAWETPFTNYPRVLNRGQWSTLPAGKIVLGVLGKALVPPGAVIVLGADDTVERRSGRQIKAKGSYRAAVRSSRKHGGQSCGLKWVTMMVLVPVPWGGRVWALLFVTVGWWPPKSRPIAVFIRVGRHSHNE